MRRKRQKIEGETAKTSFNLPISLLDDLESVSGARGMTQVAAVIEALGAWVSGAQGTGTKPIARNGLGVIASPAWEAQRVIQGISKKLKAAQKSAEKAISALSEAEDECRDYLDAVPLSSLEKRTDSAVGGLAEIREGLEGDQGATEDLRGEAK